MSNSGCEQTNESIDSQDSFNSTPSFRRYISDGQAGLKHFTLEEATIRASSEGKDLNKIVEEAFGPSNDDQIPPTSYYGYSIKQDENGGLVRGDEDIYFRIATEVAPGVIAYEFEFLDESGNIDRVSRDVAEIIVQRNGELPVQHFISKREFLDIPQEGKAFYLSVSPEGQIKVGEYDSEKYKDLYVEWFSLGWTFSWIPKFEEGKATRFIFDEDCSKAFNYESSDYPKGTDGIITLERNNPDHNKLVPQVFWAIFDLLKESDSIEEVKEIVQKLFS